MFIKQFRFEPKYVDDFIQFGYDLYKDDKKWVPPFKKEIKLQLSEEFPFYNIDGNNHCNFLLQKNGLHCGRATAIINKDLSDKNNQAVGTIGFFECQNNYSYAKILLENTVKWFKDNKIRKIWGPMNFDIWHDYRFMTKGFDHNIFYGEPYNHSYYPTFFEQFGFKTKAEFDSVEINDKNILQEMTIKGEKRYNLLIERGYRFEFADVKKDPAIIEKLHKILMSSFNQFLGFTPISVNDFGKLFQKATYALHPKMFVLAYNNKNELAGFAIALIELADAIRSMNGENNLVANLKFSYLKNRAKKINFYIGGVTPEEMSNRSGLGRAGFYVIVNEILKAGYKTMLLTLRLKGNAAHGLPGRLSPIPQKEYKLYELEI